MGFYSFFHCPPPHCISSTPPPESVSENKLKIVFEILNRRYNKVILFAWAVRSCVTARLGGVDKRNGHAPLLSLDLSQSMMRLSWMLELNPVISMYLTMIIIVLLMIIMAAIHADVSRPNNYDYYVYSRDWGHRQNMVFGFDFGFIVGIHRTAKVE